MTEFEIWLIAIGLAMDCFAVAIASGILLKRIQWRPILVMAFFFGLFQALMSLIGWLCGSTFSYLIENIDHWIAFGILSFLGGRMILESFKHEDDRKEFSPSSLKVVVTLAIATSIDAMAVGISFAFLGIKSFSDLFNPISVIGFVSFSLSIIGLLLGIKCHCSQSRKLHVELWGGVILIIIGIKILIEHLIF